MEPEICVSQKMAVTTSEVLCDNLDEYDSVCDMCVCSAAAAQFMDLSNVIICQGSYLGSQYFYGMIEFYLW